MRTYVHNTSYDAINVIHMRCHQQQAIFYFYLVDCVISLPYRDITSQLTIHKDQQAHVLNFSELVFNISIIAP